MEPVDNTIKTLKKYNKLAAIYLLTASVKGQSNIEMTEPIKEILPRNLYPEIKENLLLFSNMIDEFVNFGTHVLMWVIQASKGSDEQMPLTMFLRDLLEKADSISTLVKNSNIEPSKIILRSVFELALYIRYLVDDNFEDRSMSFLVCNARNKIRINKAFDKKDQSYQTTLKILDKDELFDRSFLDEIPSSEPVINNQYKILKLSNYHKYDIEYERTRKKDNRTPNWYRLFNGPRNIKELAEKVDIPFLYEILYRKWSENVHGTEIMSGRIVESKNPSLEEGKVNADIIQLNLPKDAQEVTTYTLLLLLMTFIKLRDQKIKVRNKEITEWYLSIRQEYQIITCKTKFINVKL